MRFLYWVPIVGLVLGIVGTAISGKAMGACNRGEATGKGMAVAGLACGIVGIVFSLSMNLAYLAVF